MHPAACDLVAVALVAKRAAKPLAAALLVAGVAATEAERNRAGLVNMQQQQWFPNCDRERKGGRIPISDGQTHALLDYA